MIFLIASFIYLAFTLIACISSVGKLEPRSAKAFILVIVACGLYVAVSLASNARPIAEILR